MLSGYKEISLFRGGDFPHASELQDEIDSAGK
jgi:hypothetical protein